MAFPADPLDCIVQIALDADLTADPTTWSWTDITEWVYEPSGVVISRGRQDEFSTAAPSQIRVTLVNDGRFCPRNPTGAYFGSIHRNTPLRVRVNGGAGYVDRATGFVDAWPVTWADKSETVSFAPVTASGLLRRLGQGGALRSPLYRSLAQAAYVESSSIVGYWPCEDESGSTSIASGIGGQAAAFGGGLEDFAADSTILGSSPLMQLVAGVSFAGYLPTYTPTGETGIRAIVKIPSAPSGNVELLRWWTYGTYPVWTVEVVPGSPDRMFLRAYNAAGVEQLGGTGINLEADGPGGGSMYGMTLYLQVDLTENAGAIDWALYAWHTFAFNQGTGGLDTGTEAASTVGQLQAIGSYNHSAAAAGTTLGHIGVATDTNYATDPAAVAGFAGTSVSLRWTGIGTELNVPTDKVGSLTEHVTYVGASESADLVDLFREVETAEQGVMFDGTAGHLTLKMRNDRYNQAAVLTLDHDAGQVDWLAPAEDDQQTTNDVTVSRPHGSQFRSFDADHIAANGNYSSRVEALLFQDADLRYHAQWRVHLGTVEELRYPTVGLNLARATSKISDWLACDIGSRIQVTNPPAGLPPDTIDLHIEGYTEHLMRSHDWRVEINTSPASPWQVFEIEDTSLGRLATDGSELLCAYDSDDTSILLASTGAPNADAEVTLWSTTAEPYDIGVGGERMTVTTMAAPAPSFVGASSATHGDNATLAPDLHISSAKGDLVLVFAAIRNTAATVGTPTGYTVLMADGNVCLFGKIHSGSESAPSVTFSGGSAGDSTSAQTATFRGYQLTRYSLANLTNSSAQDIAIPAFRPEQANTLALFLGWKADDWISVATLSGATEIGEPSTASGNDQGLVWDYVIQTTPVEYAATSFTVTGGASAVSKGYVLAVAGDVQTATVTRSVNGVVKSHSAGTAAQIWKTGVLAL